MDCFPTCLSLDKDPMPAKKRAKSTSKEEKKTTQAASGSMALEGKKAPAFELPDHSGRAVKLSDLIGSKSLVLYFYPKDMTPGCTMEACSFRDNLAALRSLGTSVVGISADSTSSHEKFKAKCDLNFPLLSDAGNSVGKRYGV